MNPPIRFSASHCALLGRFALPVEAGAVIPSGNLVCRNANGNAVLAADTAGLAIAGVGFGNGSTSQQGQISPNEYTMDAMGQPAGQLKVCVQTGLYRFRNSSTSPVTATELGKPIYVQDEQTVAKTTTNGVVAGVTVGLDNGYVWLVVGPIGTLPGNPSLGSV